MGGLLIRTTLSWRKLEVNIMNEHEMLEDIKYLIGCWFSALEDEGCEPWEAEECVNMANKYGYTMEDYRKFLRTVY